MKIGILGSGMIVPTHVDTVKIVDGVEDVAICCRPDSLERTNALAAEYNLKWVYTDYNEMLENPEIDAIYVAVPNHLHYEMSLKALQAKKYVICEKPFTTTLNEAKHLFEVAKENGVMIWEAITTIYLPNFLDMKNKLADLGVVKIVQSNYSQYSSRYDNFQKGIVMSAFDPKCCGGALMDINIYNLHMVCGLFGKPSSVNYLANIERDIDTSGIVTLDYPTFKAVCIGSKDNGAPGGTQVQGTLGYMRTLTPAFICESYEWQLNKQELHQVNVNDSKMRMKYELIAFEKMFREQDYVKYEEVKNHTLTVVEVAQMARRSAGIYFDPDKKEVE